MALPKFTGDITRFKTFWDSFNSAIHMSTDLSPIEKFNYLKALLDGPAANVIQGLSLTEDNYLAAVELVKDRYGKPDQIIAVHMDDLLKLPTCAGDKLSQLRVVYDKINMNIRCLEVLGIKAEQYGCFLILIIMSKLPDDVRLQIARVTTRDVWDVNELMKVMKTEVEAREISSTVRVSGGVPMKLLRGQTYLSQHQPWCQGIQGTKYIVSIVEVLITQLLVTR